LTVAAKSWIKTLKQTIQYKKTHKWPILIIVKSIHYTIFFLAIILVLSMHACLHMLALDYNNISCLI